jgi:hypothetical protein
MERTISFNVNNGSIIELVQFNHDGSISITKYDSKGNRETNTECITAGDFITMLNWYRYEKGKGNHSLNFE